MNNPIVLTLIATTIAWGAFIIGASSAFIFKNENKKVTVTVLGFAAGMILAVAFSHLLYESMHIASHEHQPAWLIVGGGFIIGAMFIFIIDKGVHSFHPHTHSSHNCEKEGHTSKKGVPLITALILHNIPEGLVIGISFGAAALSHHHHGHHHHYGHFHLEDYIMPLTLAAAAFLHKFPEAASASIILRGQGYSKAKAFFWGQFPGLMQPIFGILGVVLVYNIEPILPFALAFGAGAMVVVAIHELIPEARRHEKISPYFATAGLVLGVALVLIVESFMPHSH